MESLESRKPMTIVRTSFKDSYRANTWNPSMPCNSPGLLKKVLKYSVLFKSWASWFRADKSSTNWGEVEGPDMSEITAGGGGLQTSTDNRGYNGDFTLESFLMMIMMKRLKTHYIALWFEKKKHQAELTLCGCVCVSYLDTWFAVWCGPLAGCCSHVSG